MGDLCDMIKAKLEVLVKSLRYLCSTTGKLESNAKAQARHEMMTKHSSGTHDVVHNISTSYTVQHNVLERNYQYSM